MLCCPTCNKKKNNTFEVDKKVSINDFDIKDIHNLNVVYDKFEQNKLVNPEKEDVSDKIFFTKEGEIFSHEERINSTIDVCQLNRKKLIEFRKPIYDTLEKEILSRKNEKQELKRRIKEFIEETNLLQTEFYSFRTFIYKYLIKEIINTANIR